MRDEGTPKPYDRLDEAIDRTVNALMRRDAPPSIRRHVLARLAERSPSRPESLQHSSFAHERQSKAGRQRHRLAWGAAAVTLVLGSTLVVTLWRGQSTVSPVRTTGQSMPKSEVPAPAVSVGVPSEQTVRSGETDVASARLAPRIRDRAAPAWPIEDSARPSRIEPLPELDPIAFVALEPERLTTERVDIAPMEFEPLWIEPIHGER